MKLRRYLATAAVALTCTLTLTHLAEAADALPSLGADQSKTSVSGLSSGAFMAVQYQVAFSGSVIGAGVVAGGPYYCAAGSLLNAGICMGQVPFLPPNPALLLMAAQGFADMGQIDPLADLQNDRIYVFSGTRDTVVYQQAVDATVSFFQQAGVTDANLEYVNDVDAGHALITPSFGNDCPENASPYISHCNVHRTELRPARCPAAAHLRYPQSTCGKSRREIVTFNQREFAGAATGMADEAFAYVPNSCAGEHRARSTWPFTGASNQRPWWAMTSTQRRATIIGPTPTISWFCIRR